MKKSPSLALALSLALFVNALAQDPRQTTPTPTPAPQQAQADDEDVVRITTNLVQVDAVITDKSGKLVTDLRPEEVEILEDDRPQKITTSLLSQLRAPSHSRSQLRHALIRARRPFRPCGSSLRRCVAPSRSSLTI
jgi:hypothetical protein